MRIKRRKRLVKVFLSAYYTVLCIVAAYVWVVGIGQSVVYSVIGMVIFPLLVYLFKKCWGWAFIPEEAEKNGKS